MASKSTKNMFYYSLMVVVLLTVTIQPNQYSFNEKYENDDFLNIDPYVEAKGILENNNLLEINNDEIYNYPLISSWSDVGSVYDVVVDGIYAFVADGTNGLRILDISNMSNPSAIGQFKEGSAICRGVYKNNNYVYIAYGLNGLIIVDIAQSILTPPKVGQISFGSYECYAVDIDGDWAYTASGGYGLGVIDIKDPTNPILKGRFYKTGVDIRDLDLYISFAYIADFNYGIRRIDVLTNKINPQESGSGYPSGQALGIYVRSDYRAFVADYNGFYILSLYSYPQFSVLSQYSDGNHTNGIFVEKNTAFVSYAGDMGLKIFNVTTVTNPKLIGQYFDTGPCLNVKVKEDYAYICDGSDGLEILRLDNDSDGIYDGYEIYDLSSDVNDSDSDNDTLIDGDEFYGLYAPNNAYADDKNHYFYDLDLLNLDTDNDTIRDDEEVYPGLDGFKTDPEHKDSDKDNLDDNEEINGLWYPSSPYQNGTGYIFTNPNIYDSDSDLVKDGIEYEVYGTDPLSKDTDQDGMPDYYEITYNLNPIVDDAALDKDNDGIINFDEFNLTRTNPSNNDSDSDFISDGEEINGIYWPTNPNNNGTGYIITGKPLDPDSDDDGLKDGEEVKTYLTDPLKIDTDNDDLNDKDEVITYNTDPNDQDTDFDQMDDWWEVTFGTNPLVNDTTIDLDNDNLTNIEEYQYQTNPKDADSDNDGMNDGYEITYSYNPNNHNDGALDTDFDGLTNKEECEASTNPRLADTDSDGLGDQWEVENGTNPLEDDANEDPDSDGLTNLQEMNTNSDPFDDDSDGDGLSDSEEVLTYGTNPSKVDTDGDGVNDKTEIEAGTDPLNPKSNPRHQKSVIILSISISAAIGILFLLTIFFIFTWTSRPEQKIFKYLNELKLKGIQSVSVKEISIQLGKKLFKGDIKQIINEYSEVKGYTLRENRVWLSSKSQINKHITNYKNWLNKSKTQVFTKTEKDTILNEIKNDITMCQKLQFNDLEKELMELLLKIE